MQDVAHAVEKLARVRVGHAGGRAGHRNEYVYLLQPRDGQKRFGIAGFAGLGHAVKRVDRAREPVTGEPVFRGFHEHHPVPCIMERSGQFSALVILPPLISTVFGDRGHGRLRSMPQ